MSERTGSGPPDPPFEAADEPSDQPAGKMRERVRQVLSTLSEPVKVSTIGEMADCSAEGARNALREYAEMGLVVQTNDNPEMYERNPAYFQFLRGHRLTQDHTTEELREKLVEKYNEHYAFVERFDAPSPEDVEVDERESSERFDAVFDWEALLSEVDDLREAYRQQTGTMPPAIEDFPVEAGSETTDLFDFGFLEEINRSMYLASMLDVPTGMPQYRRFMEAIQNHLPDRDDSEQLKSQPDSGE